MEVAYFNIICEEISALGGKIVHIDETCGSIEDVHKVVDKYYERYPNAKWELYVMGLRKREITNRTIII